MRKLKDKRMSTAMDLDLKRLVEDSAWDQGISDSELIRRGAIMNVREFTPDLYEKYLKGEK